MLGPSDLVLCSGTLLGSSLRDLVRAAAAGGFQGISLWARDYRDAQAQGLSDADIRTLLADHGLRVGEVDPLARWLPGSEPGAGTPPLAAELYELGEDDYYGLAEAVGARSINVVEIFGAHAPVDRVAEAFAGVCDRAAEHGLLAHLEFLPWSGVPDLETAASIVRAAARPNAGVTLDTWHFSRSGSPLGALEKLPGNQVGAVQLSDAPATAASTDLPTESVEARLLPGDGDADLVELVRVLDRIDSRAPIGVEVFSARLRELPAEEVGRRAGETARAILAAARSEP